MSEEMIYSDNNVHVSTHRIVVGGATYVLRHVSAIRMIAVENDNCMIGGFFLGGGGIVGFITVLFVIFSGWSVGVFFWLLFAGLSIWLGGRLGESRDYCVCIDTSSGKVNALRSSDKNYIGSLAACMNDAVVNYG